MKPISDAICEITQNVWESILGQEINPSAEDALMARVKGRRTLTGCVQLAGAWEGTVFLYCSASLAGELAAVMFGATPGTLGNGDIEDAWGELTNMIAGNLKVLLPRPCQLSLPAVVQGLDYQVVVPGTTVYAQAFLECRGEPVLVTLLEGSTSRSGAAFKGGAST
jgi:chemotaxis protein CheX